MSARPLKVYAISLHVADVDGYGYRRCIVAATSMRRAQELLNVGQSHFQMYYSLTADEDETSIALAAPETAYAQSPVSGWFRPVTLDNGRRVVALPPPVADAVDRG